MSRVTIRGLHKTFDGKPTTTAIDTLDLDIAEGEFVALLGPSGCGKTTTLRCVAGLERPDAGSISIGGEDVFDSASRVNVPPDRRKAGMVFQAYALWPHMTVRKNLEYPLKARGRRDLLKAGRVEEVARMVECEHLLDRLPAQLSGGQQQRVALARALAAKPQVILFDEPLSNLDARLRDQMRTEIHRIHRSQPFTAIYVTHDQSEALALGQRIAIMRSGALEQLGTPEQIFEDPTSEYVAGFIGMSNRLPVHRSDDGWSTGAIELVGAVEGLRWPEHAVLRFSPRDGRLVPGRDHLAEHEVGLPVTVEDAEFGGRDRHFVLDSLGTSLRSTVPLEGPGTWTRTVDPGDRVLLALDPQRVVVFPDDTAPTGAPAPVAVGGAAAARTTAVRA
ncbi:sn-glycerol-3-phosphate ABC transporter ATP-binding protein UgpC [Rhodococcus aerolatus]